MDIGYASGRELGIATDKIDAVANWRTSPHLSDDERLVVEYAEQLSLTPATVSDAVHARLRRRFSEHQIVELTHAVAWEHARSRFNRAFRIGADGYTS